MLISTTLMASSLALGFAAGAFLMWRDARHWRRMYEARVDSDKKWITDMVGMALAQSKAQTANEAVAVHAAVIGMREPPEPMEHVLPPPRGIKLGDGSGMEIEFSEPIDPELLEGVPEERILR